MHCVYSDLVHSCTEPVFDCSNYCILHLDYPIDIFSRFSADFFYLMRIIDEKNKAFNNKLNSQDYDFSGAKLIDIDFRGKLIKKNVKFWDSTIYGDVDFSNAVIEGFVGFNGAQIYGSLLFLDTNVEGNLDFKGASLAKNVVFNGSKINGDFEFFYVSLSDIFIFRNGEVQGSLVFSPYTINGVADFYATVVHQRFELYAVKFIEDVRLENMKIMEDMYLHGTIFCRNAFFNWIKVFGDARFEDVHFADDVDFEKAIFNGAVYFIKKDQDYEMFGKRVNFNESSFLTKALFSELESFHASFEGSRLRNVAFRYCNLKKVRFKDVIFENCELSSSNLPKFILEDFILEYDISVRLGMFLDLFLPKVIKISLFDDFVNESRTVSDTYRRIRQCLQSQGAYADAGEFYIKELDMKRNVYWKENTINWITFTLLKFLTGYGEKPGRLVILILILSGLFLYLNGIEDPSVLCTNGCLIIQIILMPFVMALFVFTFARKMSR